jgi:hyperosmotically inducible periplasmic protein
MRALLRAFLVVLVVVAVAFLLLGYWGGSRWARGSHEPAVGTSGQIDVQRARERGAELGEKAAVAGRKMEDAVGEAALTTKIKAKMALDDSVKARAIDVTTNGSTVTVSGSVRSNAERERVVTLAKETAGVTRVVDNLQVVR